MLSLHFGTSSERLFGVYHPAESSQIRTCGVVLCAPIGHEYIRAHRTLRQLAVNLSRSGFHVFRFDYFGCGDSAGEAEDGSVGRWLADIETAIDELLDTAGLRRVCLVGLRLGATLAAHVAERRSDVESIVLWDPVLTGGKYLEDLRRLQWKWLRDRPGSRLFAFNRRVPEVIGFPLTAVLRSGIEQIDLNGLRRTSLRRIVVMGSEDHSTHREWIADAGGPWPDAIGNSGSRAGDWHRPELVHTALLASRMMQRVGGLVQEHVT